MISIKIMEAWKNGERNFSNIKSVSMSFNRGILDNAIFSEADLRFSNFMSSALRNVNFKYANLCSVCFHNAYLEGADFTGANLVNTDFSYASYNDKTIFPEGFNPKEHNMRYSQYE